VPRSRYLAWLAKGWTLESDLQDTHHGRWSVLMRGPE
jgi:hypothetical protein